MSGIYGNIPNYNGMNGYGYQPYQNQMNQLGKYMEQLNNINNNNNNINQVQPTKQQTNMEFVKVANMQQAKEWIVQNNQSVWMQDSSEPYLYYKSVDNLGSVNFRIVKIEDVTDKMLNNVKEQNNTQETISIENFNKLQYQVNDLSDRLNIYEKFIHDTVQNNKQVEINDSKKGSKPKSNSIPNQKEANK